MDVLSRRGIRATKDMDQVQLQMKQIFPQLLMVPTPITYPAHVDYLMFWSVDRKLQLRGVVETKMRYSGVDIETMQDGQLLIVDQSKIEKGIALSTALGVNYYFDAFIVADQVLLRWEIYNVQNPWAPKGIRCDLKEVKGLATKKNINTNEKHVDKLYGLNIKDARIFKGFTEIGRHNK